MNWLNSGTDHQSTIAVLPDIAAAYDALYQSLWRQPHLPAEILELCRLRLAQLHRSAVELQRQEQPIMEGKRDHLNNWDTDSRFSDAERACLAFTEVYAMDTQAITDELAEAVKLHVGDAGLVLLVEALGILDGRTRLSLLWQLPATVDADTKGVA
jgi:alkylhydroperoxidase family enzyme